MNIVVKLSVLTRYVFVNFIESFLIGFIIFNFIIILTSQLYQVIKWLVDGVYGLFDVLKYLLFISPIYLNYVIPVSVVFAVVSCIGKLSSNFEIIAINSFGISTMIIFRRIVILGFLISLVHFIFNEFWAYRFISIGLDMYYSASKDFKGVIKNFSHISQGKDSVSYLWAEEYIGDIELMKGVFIVVKDKISKLIKKNIVSEIAKKKTDNVWVLYNVVIYDYIRGTKISIMNIEYTFEFLNDKKRKKHREEMNVFSLYSMAKEYEKAGFKDLAFDMYVKLNLKFIFPFSGFFLLFLVFPFSLTKVRVSNFLGIVLSISVAIGYYVLLTFFQLLCTKTGVLIFLWFPNFLSTFLGGILIFMKNIHYE
ncbi:MAG: LptF/LptG family permease [bacterium]